MLNFKVGQVVLLKNTQSVVGNILIRWFTHSDYSHAAIVLPDNDGKLALYEAIPWHVRKIGLPNYWDELVEEGFSDQRWRHKNDKPLIIELWESPTLLNIAEMQKEAEVWLGVHYSMVINYLFCTDKVDCSEYVGRILEKTGILWGEEHSRISPEDVRVKLASLNWKKTQQHIFKY